MVVVCVVVAVVVGVVVAVERTHPSKSSVCAANTAAFTIATSSSHSATSATKWPARVHEKLPSLSPIVNFSTIELSDSTVVPQSAVLSRNAVMVDAVLPLDTATALLLTSEKSKPQVSSKVWMWRMWGSIKLASACTMETPSYS